jgi:large subunit ribosomal protein L13
MDMNRCFFLRKEDRAPKWRIIDANGKVLGRLATQIADALRGKDKPNYTPHTDCGDYVVVINADKVVLTGKKLAQKEYITYSGWQGGKKVTLAKDMLRKHPTQLLQLAVKRMLPKNRLNNQVIKKLKLYVGEVHPHVAQI